MNEITDNEFKQLAEYIKANYGITITDQKRELLNARLYNTLLQNGYKSFTDFYDALVNQKNRDAVTTLINRITTNHTFFMREREHFYYYRDTVLPYLTNEIDDNDLRIWCAACSSGEESYTLAMITDEYFGKNKLFWDTKILATDISDKVLEEAKTGIYPLDRLTALPPAWRMNYFTDIGGRRCKVGDRIRGDVIYRKFNLMEKYFPFKKNFHVIFCRNVMIYFDNETKVRLVNKFYDILEPGGYLFIGHSEFIAKNESNFKYIMPAVYRKI